MIKKLHLPRVRFSPVKSLQWFCFKFFWFVRWVHELGSWVVPWFNWTILIVFLEKISCLAFIQLARLALLKFFAGANTFFCAFHLCCWWKSWWEWRYGLCVPFCTEHIWGRGVCKFLWGKWDWVTIFHVIFSYYIWGKLSYRRPSLRMLYGWSSWKVYGFV